jgi:hypothetical protein
MGPLQMDHEWTTDIESALLNREKVAEGKGFEPLDRVNGRRFSRPPISRNGQHSTTPDNEATGLRQDDLLSSPPHL